MNKNFNRPNFKRNQQKEQAHRTNQMIQAPKVRLVGDNVEIGVYSTYDAIKKAQELNLDLIEISPNADPPVCKIMDYQKFLYEQKMREKEQARRQKENNKEMKEMRFTANTDEGDIETKKKKIIEFLKLGHKVKTVVIFKGRELQHKERGEMLLLKLAQDIAEFGKVDNLPKLEGKNMLMMLSPKK